VSHKVIAVDYYVSPALSLHPQCATVHCYFVTADFLFVLIANEKRTVNQFTYILNKIYLT